MLTKKAEDSVDVVRPVISSPSFEMGREKKSAVRLRALRSLSHECRQSSVPAVDHVDHLYVHIYIHMYVNLACVRTGVQTSSLSV